MYTRDVCRRTGLRRSVGVVRPIISAFRADDRGSNPRPSIPTLLRRAISTVEITTGKPYALHRTDSTEATPRRRTAITHFPNRIQNKVENMSLPEKVPVLTEKSIDQLSERQQMDYEMHRRSLLEWLSVFGKDPDRVEGYSTDTVIRTAYRLDQFYRWVWAQDGYTTNISHAHANSYLRELATTEKSNTHKSNTVSSLKRLFKWKANDQGAESWEPEFRFSESNGASQPRDFFTREERSKLREAALEYGSIPGYNDLTPEERSQWKAHLAQRFEKPKSEVTPADWERANGWKVPSLMWVSLDSGLRPVEVGQATTHWVDLDNGVLRIPKEDSAKNRENWLVGLTERTTEALNRWLTERRNYAMYGERDELWLTREGNPYASSSLRYLIRRLCEEAGISTDERGISWYAIRHSVGTYMTREEDLAAAAAQLRHKSTHTTMKYDNTPIEDRKDALERME